MNKKDLISFKILSNLLLPQSTFLPRDLMKNQAASSTCDVNAVKDGVYKQ
jgi:hypothetical protein